MENQRRALSEIVSLEAWHTEFSNQSRKVDLFVDVAFMTGRIGSEAESPVRFELSLKRAEVVVVVPLAEPLSVDPRSVSRDGTAVAVKSVIAKSDTNKTSGGLAGKAGLDGVGVSSRTAEEASRSKGHTQETVSAAMKVIQARTADGDYRWTVTSSLSDRLDGHPWDVSSHPRLKLIDGRPAATGLAPTARVEVRCLREDIQIEKIHLKDERRFAFLGGRAGHKNRMAAAEAAVRDRLFKEGLVAGEEGNPYAYMTLAVLVPDAINND